jgi:hypothetical protein
MSPAIEGSVRGGWDQEIWVPIRGSWGDPVGSADSSVLVLPMRRLIARLETLMVRLCEFARVLGGSRRMPLPSSNLARLQIGH